MPEIPDVEVFRRYFDATSLKQKINQVDVLDERILSDISTRKLGDGLKGKTFQSTVRHGKFMFAETDSEQWLVLHFGMTGFLSYLNSDDELPAHTRVLFTFENDHKLAFVDQRILRLAGLTTDPEAYAQGRDLGPDALQMTLDEFTRTLNGKRGAIKSALTNQAIIAGIGNIYADEILFQSRIHPKRPANRLSSEEFQTIHDQMHIVCQEAIDAEVDVERMPDWFLLRHREDGADCPRCGTNIQTMKVSSRTAYYCPQCQSE